MCSVGVITIRAQALAIMTITSHPSLLSHPSIIVITTIIANCKPGHQCSNLLHFQKN
jgi:hypothetical protein